MPIKPIGTVPVPNPLHEFASYSYAVSLWWMHPTDYETLMSSGDVVEFTSFNLVTQATHSYVIAEDSGLYPHKRHPASNNLNYNIQEIEMTTWITSGHTGPDASNAIIGSFTILEPYGVTLVDVLSKMSWDDNMKQYKNYLDQPYILQIEFTGYDDFGNPIPQSSTAKYRKMFPILLRKMGVSVTTRGTEYKCNFVPCGHDAYNPENITIPTVFNFTAGTVAEFFNILETKYNTWWNQQTHGSFKYSKFITFDLDNEIGRSNIVNKDLVGLKDMDPNSVNSIIGGYLDPSKITWAIPAGTSMLTIITKILSHSDYLIHQFNLEGSANPADSQSTILNLFKVACAMKIEGLDNSGTVCANVYDKLAGEYTKSYNFKIYQAPTWKASHPSMPQFSDYRNFVCKVYDYLYTGQNIDILNWDVKFDLSYHSQVIANTNTVAALNPNPDIANVQKAQLIPTLFMTPSALSVIDPALRQLNQVQNCIPIRTVAIGNDKQRTTGLGIENRPAAMAASDAVYSTFDNNDSKCLTVNLEIVGDPTLIKQDDWGYVPSPSTDKNYYNWDTKSQAEFATEFGHFRMDTGDFLVELNLRNPTDTDIDTTNQGLAVGLTASSSLFSGGYTLTKVVSTFRDGKFTQRLDLKKLVNGSLIASSQEMQTNRVSANKAASWAEATQLANNLTNSGTTTQGTQTGPYVAGYDPTRPYGF